jgi:hypothetical protein
MRYALWVIRVQLAVEPLELTFDNAEDYGLRPDDLVADSQGPCQALGEAFRAGGPSAFIAPSAALPGTRNLVVLEPRVAIGYELEPLDDVDCPTSLLSQGGRCPEGLWHLVHYRGTLTQHAGLDAWQNGDEFILEEPEVTSATLSV